MHNGVIMPSEVRHLVDTGATYPVVRFAGVLDSTTSPAVRSALLDVLAGQPAALVIDVDALRVPDDASVGVVSEVARDTVDWPAAQLALCAGGDPVAWRSTGLPVSASPAEAFTDFGEPYPAGRRSLELEPVVGAARPSRELVTDACGHWEHTALVDSACIVVTEMVNNVVAHARTPMTVLLALRGGAVAVAVRDSSTAVPVFRGQVDPHSYGGRGLLLIDSVADRWGSLRLDGGKVVWAILQDQDAGSAMARGHPESRSMADPGRG